MLIKTKLVKILFIILYLSEIKVLLAMEKSINKINLLADLPIEIIAHIIEFIPISDPANQYLRVYRKLKISEKSAIQTVNSFYEKELLLNKNLNNFISKIKNHHNKLEEPFPNYAILKKAYDKIMLESEKLSNEAKILSGKIDTAIKQHHWTMAKKILKQTIRENKIHFLENLNANRKINTQLIKNNFKKILELNLVLHKVKWQTYYTLIIEIFKSGAFFFPIISAIGAVYFIFLYLFKDNSAIHCSFSSVLMFMISITYTFDIYRRFFSNNINPNSIPLRAIFKKSLKLLRKEKKKFRQILEKN